MSHRARNLELFKSKPKSMFGGALQRSHPKSKRPLSTKHAVHLVLKSNLARGTKSFLSPRNAGKIESLIRKRAKIAGVRIYHFVNVGNHIHLVIRLHNRAAYANFVRTVTGLIARHVLGAQRNAAKGLKFWQARPFTRLVSWGRDYNRLRDYYMEKNRIEALGGNPRLVAWGFHILDPAKILRLETG